MEAQDQLCGWKVDEPRNFYPQTYHFPNNKHHLYSKSVGRTSPLKKKRKIDMKEGDQKQTKSNNKLYKIQNSNYKGIYQRFHKKKLMKPPQSLNGSVDEIYKCLDKKISYPMMNGSYFKLETPKNKFVPSCSIDKIDAFFYSLESSSSSTQMVIKTNDSVPCRHQLTKIIENNMELKRKYSKMLMDQQKENVGIKKIPIKDQILSNVKCWSKFPAKNNITQGKIKELPKFLSQKTKKCFSSHLELDKKFRQNPDKSTFQICAIKIK